MANPPFRVPYPRPKIPSNLGTSGLKSALTTRDENLNWSDFRILLGPGCADGAYEERCYFLPLAFSYILAHDDDALELITSLVWYCSEYVEKLRADKIIDAARSGIRACFEHWTKHFEVVHFDSEACRAKGWGLEHYDYVRNIETVCEGLESLVRYKSHSDLAVAFIMELSQSSDPVKQSWFLELLRSKIDAVAYYPPNHPEIVRFFENKERIRLLVNSIRDTVVPSEKSPTYWPDSLALIEAYCEAI